MSANELTPEQQEQQRALLRVWLRQQVAQTSDEMVREEDNRIRQFAQRLSDTEIDNSQIRNLENLAYTTDKVSDITDLLKKLIGRDTRSKRWAQDNLGVEIIAALGALRGEAERIVREISEDLPSLADDDLPRRVHLELCREFAKHLAAEFLYLKKGEAR